MARAALLLIPSLLLSACATWRGPSADDVLAGLPASAELANVPFHPQTEYHCGPAALATVLEYNGVKASPDELADWVYVPERRGSLQSELLATARQRGQIAYRLPADPTAVFREVAAGRPVLVMENLGLIRVPVWHYAVMIGYSVDTREVIQHSGTEQALRQSFRHWLRSWQRAGQWAMIAVAPGELPSSDDPDGWIRALADFDQAAASGAAHQAWLATTERWPEQPMAWFGLGNSSAAIDDLAAAEAAFEKTLILAPDHGPARFNLARLAIMQDEPCRALPWLEALEHHESLGERAAHEWIAASRACRDK